MPQSRRSFAAALCLGPLASVGARATAAQEAPAVVPDMRAQLVVARGTLPAASLRGQAALDRTLERLDDLRIDLAAGRLILVNVAAAELIAYEGGREALRSRVIVGANRTRTPQLSTFVTSARTNPPWYVPASIEPEIRAAGAVGFRTVNGRLVQPPGPTNPLGQLRIGLYDSDGIFLHGTSNPGLFARASRTLSHGCVRVERIRDLAAWMLGITPEAMQAMIATGRTFELAPPQDVQVTLAYLTSWPDSAGRLVTHGDPYGLDGPGVRRAAFRRVSRPVRQTPAEAEETARGAAPEDNPL
jgi:murein L,D-transpeptidase YcbB/YkuD